MNAINHYPHLIFSWGDTYLDLISAKILWDYDPNQWQEFLLQHPGFEKIKRWDNAKISGMLKNEYHLLSTELHSKTQLFTNYWLEIENDWFAFLESFFEAKGLFAAQVFTAHLGIGQVFPRDINNRSFLVSHKLEKNPLLRLCAHETSHFYFYRCLCQLHPKLTTKLMGSKKIWLLSEILVPLLFSTVASRNLLGQQSFDSYVCQKQLLLSFKDCFTKRINNKLSVAGFFDTIMNLPIDRELLDPKFRHNYKEDL